ncbi:MAG: hypothetical protein ACM3ZB_01775 [bacterium]|jgi:zinc protease
MNAVLAIALALTGAAWAQESAKPAALTVEQIMDKSIEALGGRAALEKITSTVIKSKIDVTFAGLTASSVIYMKAPDKRASVTTVDGYGQIKEGCDGSIAWNETPDGGFQEFSGERLLQAKRLAVFQPELRWREIYPHAEVKGKEVLDGREAWVLTLFPKSGKPVTEYIDAETFLPVKNVVPIIDDQGEYDVTTELSDFREVQGVKFPFTIRQSTAMGDLIIEVTEINNNVPIEDTVFAKPSK